MYGLATVNYIHNVVYTMRMHACNYIMGSKEFLPGGFRSAARCLISGCARARGLWIVIAPRARTGY